MNLWTFLHAAPQRDTPTTLIGCFLIAWTIVGMARATLRQLLKTLRVLLRGYPPAPAESPDTDR